jgi:23S rRNA (uridine2552-2'-O)-methyltransferase
MTKKKSSKKWIQNHLSDKYVKLAGRDKLKSRASYKLKQINERYRGGWSQVAQSIVKDKGLVIAVDILPVTGISSVEVITGDIFTEEVLKRTDEILQERGFENAALVMSDMAPNLTGISSTDSARSYELNKRALYYAGKFLKKDGGFVVKIFQNEYFKEYLNEVKKMFSSCSVYKPDASRSKSSEIYIVAKKKRNASLDS